MKKRLCRSMAIVLLMFSVAVPSPVKADFFGGDLPLLMQIIVNTLQQLAQLKAILGNAQDTLGLLRDVNEGIREAMGIMRTMNTTIQPGIFSQFQNPEQVLRAIQDVYGMIPRTADARMEQLNDQSVAEAITLHNQAFAYAAQVDPEAERIKDYSRDVSPAGAGRLTAQSLGVLIHVTNQVLRTNAAMLKLLSQNLALQNRKEKINSQQFKMQYDGISSAMKGTASFKSMSNLGQ